MKRFPFMDEQDAHIFIEEKKEKYLKKQKIKHGSILYSFMTTPGVLNSEEDAYSKIKGGAFILSATFCLLSFYTKEYKNVEIPFAVIYRNDRNYIIVFLFLDI